MKQKRDPEAYLKLADDLERKSKLGKLKIYLGAAPGVGKTYQMLSDALNLRAQGMDVVIGAIMTHGREEVESLASAFEKIPMLPVQIQKHVTYALDLDGIIQRAPGIVLVDEAAYRNPSGLRHQKRWQDILELIERGIDVVTTLNVQHIESLNDVVSQLIAVPIYETVSDDFIEKADVIELVDLPSEELIVRLKQGKVYVPSEIGIAANHFFKKNNLDALRELALRVVAERVGSEVVNDYSKTLSARLLYKQDCLLVCIRNNAAMPKLIRAAKRLAMRLKCSWVALYVDTGNKKNFFAVQDFLQLADSLGAKTQVVFAVHELGAIKEYIIKNRVTQVVIAHEKRPWWKLKTDDEILFHELKDIGIYRIDLFDRKKSTWFVRFKQSFKFIALALLFSSLILGNALHLIFSLWYLVWLLGLIVVTIASLEEWPKVLIWAFVLLGFDLLLNEYSLSLMTVNFGIWLLEYGRWFMTLMLMSTALITALIYVRQKLYLAQELDKNNNFLLGFLQALSLVRGREAVVQQAYFYLKNYFHQSITVFLWHEKQLYQFLPQARFENLDDKEKAMVQWVLKSGEPAGKGTTNLVSSEALYLPLKGGDVSFGVLRFDMHQGKYFSVIQKKNLMVCLQQLATILELERQEEQTKTMVVENLQTQVRDELLFGFAQQLYQPFVRLLELLPQELDSSHYKQLLQRLSKHLEVISYFSRANLLQDFSLQDMVTLIQTVLDEHAKQYASLSIVWLVEQDLPKIWVQADLMKVVVENIFDNIFRHANAASEIEISVHKKQNHLLVSIADSGPGLPESELTRLFDYFYQVNAVVVPDGLGLGLSLAERIISWHHGKIWAENRHPHGAIFNFIVPLDNPKRNSQNKGLSAENDE